MARDTITEETACPACGAPAGTACEYTVNGETWTAPHDARAYAHWGFALAAPETTGGES